VFQGEEPKMTRLSATTAIAIWLAASGPGQIAVSQDMTGAIEEHIVVRGDTLASLGARAGVDARVIAAMNGLRAGAALHAGDTICLDNRHIVPAGRGSIVINVPQRMLFAMAGDTRLAFPVALGRPTWPTPVGPFTILTKEVDPTWDVPVSIQQELIRAGKPPLTTVAPGPDNPLGDRWFGLSIPGVGIHGTNAPGSIYRHQTHGCIRLHPDDIRTLFDRVSVGADGEIVYQPLLLALIDGRVYLESHPDIYRRLPDPLTRLRAAAAGSGLTRSIDWGAAAAVIRESAGVARDVSGGG
jgi:L,D-transpeptidase ErfK/SrfK